MRTTSDFDPRAAARKLLREARSGALATLMAGSGHPCCSLVNVATAADGAPLLLISRLAVHTENILADPRASLMLDERRRGDPLEGARITLIGTIAATDAPDARRRYLARQPGARMYAGFTDFSVYRMTPSAAHLVAGFGRIVDLAPADILTDLHDAEALVAAEADICAEMNRDHAETLRDCAVRLLGANDALWCCVGCDPEGLELQHDVTALRLVFPRRVATPEGLRTALGELAQQARAAAAQTS